MEKDRPAAHEPALISTQSFLALYKNTAVPNLTCNILSSSGLNAWVATAWFYSSSTMACFFVKFNSSHLACGAAWVRQY
jgi:hypothetical protein